MYVCELRACLVSTEVRGRCLVCWIWNDSWLRTPLYVLGIKPWSFGRELNNKFNHRAIYPGPAIIFQFFYLSEIVSS